MIHSNTGTALTPFLFTVCTQYLVMQFVFVKLAGYGTILCLIKPNNDEAGINETATCTLLPQRLRYLTIIDNKRDVAFSLYIT